MIIQLCYDDSPGTCVEKLNELLKPEKLWICTTEEAKDDEDGCIAYELLKLK